MERWPNFFIVGAEKAGTSSLYEYFKNIPEIYMSPNKEPRYFSGHDPFDNSNQAAIQDKKKYLDLFVDVKDEKIIGEASPGNLVNPLAAQRIHKISPNARILISLRDPIDRIFSEYLMTKRQGRIKTSFHDAIQNEIKHGLDKRGPDVKIRLFAGLYSKDVKNYLDVFGIEQVKIIIFEEWIQEPKKMIEEVMGFLGLNYSITDFKNEAYNEYGVSRGLIATWILKSNRVKLFANTFFSTPTKKFLKEKFVVKKTHKPIMSEKDREILINFYRKDIKKLETLLGRELPWQNY